MMASPRPAANAAGSSTQPLTPPADAPAPTNPVPQTAQAATSTAATPAVATPPQFPATSLQDTGKSRRPRDARLIHMLLASMGVTAYQERVPLQLLDFAYRYTSSTLQDAVYLATEGYLGDTTSAKPGEGAGGGKGGQEINITLQALRMSIASRLHYQFQPGLPKEFLMEIAAERNRILLPGVSRGAYDANAANNANASNGIVMGGMRLPPERFCLTGVSWGLKEEWESEGEEEMEVDSGPQQQSTQPQEKESQEAPAEDEDVDGNMEDIFGDGDLDDNDHDEDKTMTGV
ncbi:hypothetical protein VTO42DRAFT_2995 [Malbranchea cinnamomea]